MIAPGAGAHDLGSLTLNDVLQMIDRDHDLTILGDTDDSIKLSGDNWQQGATQGGFVEYSNSDDPTVHLKIDEDIHTSVA